MDDVNNRVSPTKARKDELDAPSSHPEGLNPGSTDSGLREGIRARDEQAWARQAENSMGEANLKGNASLEATDISVNKVRFRAEGDAKVQIEGVERLGELIVSEEGGKIEIREGAKQP